LTRVLNVNVADAHYLYHYIHKKILLNAKFGVRDFLVPAMSMLLKNYNRGGRDHG
jgi:hypothetical protein